ncbi:MAG: hypothetical protein DRJ99_00710 [Thermoplasmata archaeon]|nr:MAG: hypothetical protein DRJ99_00710 [Thermoplasmata archaeon]HDM25327.1 hypothetical protein [Thermoplasmatales archaeon]
MIYYIHGYLSSPNSEKGKLLKEKLGVIPIKYRDCKPEELVIRECIDRIKSVVSNDKNIVLIGSSLGGYLAAETAFELKIDKLILLNPAIVPPDANTEDIDLPARILEEMKDERLLSTKIPSDLTILMATEDEVIPKDWILNFAMAQESKVMFSKDDHRFSRNMIRLPEIISKIMECF